jgi:small subunit ribosomal protein S1
MNEHANEQTQAEAPQTLKVPQGAETPEGVETPEVAETSEVAETQAAETQQTVEAPQSAEAAQNAQANEERRKRAQAMWQRIVDAKSNAETIQGIVKSPVKGGLLVDLDGFRGFLPASQVRVPKGTSLESLVRSTLPLRVLEIDQERKRAVVSHRRALDDERRAARAQLLRSLTVGEEREATVLRLTDFGAFVDLGGVDALVPASELAFERIEKPADVVHIGEHLKVRILRVEEGGKKIAASRKAALADPWRDNAELLRQGKVVEGKVTATSPRLEVEIAPGVVGTIGERDANPEDYEIGEKVEVSVRSVDYRNRRLRLSTLHSASSFSSTSFAPLGVELRRSSADSQSG